MLLPFMTLAGLPFGMPFEAVAISAYNILPSPILHLSC